MNQWIRAGQRRRSRLTAGLVLWLGLGAAALPATAVAREFPMLGDTLDFTPPAADSTAAEEPVELEDGPVEWLRAPFGERLLMDANEWRARGHGNSLVAPMLDYNRVDPFRFGLGYQAQDPETMLPRFGARLEYATGRKRVLYGFQLEQPLVPRWLAIGVSAIRMTDHSELQQVENVENSMALLFGRQDYRDYFEREGFGVYLTARPTAVSTVSLHARSDDYRTLPTRFGTRSWFNGARNLRANPPIADGEARRAIVRLERLAHRTQRTRAGFYHWVEFEKAGGDRLGGDFDYSRALADLRSVLRLSPASTLAVRLVGGSTRDGILPPQRAFTVGGVDGLRAHRFAEFGGDQVLLAQAEYTLGLWRLRSTGFEGGLHAIAFLDAGRAWSNPDHDWDPSGQHLAVDGGFGLGTAEDNLRFYFAKNLQDPDAGIVISARLHRPF